MFPNACSNITTLASRRDNPLSRESTLYSEVVQRRDEPDAPGNCEKGELRAETRPTEDELRRLRRVPGRIPWSACTITIIELFERFSFNGTFVVFVNFLQQPLPPNSKTGAGFRGQSGALNMGQRVSTAISLSNSLWMSTAPLFGAFIADQYLGRYKTLQWSNVITIVGHFILIISALPRVIVHSLTALIPFLVGVILMGIGFGGIKPNIATLVVEQLPDTELRVAIDRKGRRVIIDPEATRSRILLYFYGFINVGSITGMIAMVYAEKYVGFWLSFTVPSVTFLICPLILFGFRKKYASAPPSGSVLGKAFRLCLLSMKGQWSWNPATVYRNIHHPDFWNRVKPSRITERPAWMTHDDSWVDEVSRGIRACRCFCWYPLYWPALRQMGSNMMSQAATLNLGGLPNDLLINLNPLFCILLAPFYAHIVYPVLARIGLRFCPIHRISAGFLCAALGMAMCTVVQHLIYSSSACGKHANHCPADRLYPKPSVWLQLPVYLLLANSEILANVTGIEYAYSQAPSNMRSLVMALFYFTGAFGSAISQALVPLSEDPDLVWNYATVSVLSLVASVGVWWSNRKPKKTEGMEEETENETEEERGRNVRDLDSNRSW
ncbi:oligopeptide transporter [Trematosphaeria pertusa]|uniref:Oligopeptide transporter n=1 Tax=Trematosphaeria pertusa TaxID=390896 RepID=A0A6A6IQ67_9PLEO|nr:oligopeptide transporter [Trematosphaeria pertusa]KAF2252611.1 oligopeptide transporter [Trematosphaeria pertusa]